MFQYFIKEGGTDNSINVLVDLTSGETGVLTIAIDSVDFIAELCHLHVLKSGVDLEANPVQGIILTPRLEDFAMLVTDEPSPVINLERHGGIDLNSTEIKFEGHHKEMPKVFMESFPIIPNFNGLYIQNFQLAPFNMLNFPLLSELIEEIEKVEETTTAEQHPQPREYQPAAALTPFDRNDEIEKHIMISREVSR